jgi:hypothetical protein
MVLTTNVEFNCDVKDPLPESRRKENVASVVPPYKLPYSLPVMSAEPNNDIPD